MRCAFLIAVTLALAACNDYPPERVPAVPSESAAPEFYRPESRATYAIGPGDSVVVNSYYHPELKQTVTIQPDGRISLMLVGEVTAAGKAPSQLAKELTRAYRKFLNDAEITVTLSGGAEQSVYVGGEVSKPATISMKDELTLTQALTGAGGFLKSANKEQVLILRQTVDGHYRTMQVNAELILSNEAEEIYLRRHDVVFVPKTHIAQVADYVDQYINQIIPRQVGVGFGYSLGMLGGGGGGPTPTATAVVPAQH